jgi:iron complex transport system permease protein
MKLSTLSLILLLAALLTISGALLTGPWNLTVGRLFELLFTPHSASLPPQASIVFWQIRLPRIIAALAIGASLSAAGAAYQGMFRNPLVSPDILGVAAGAGLGACLAIWLGLSIFYIQLLAFCGGLLVVLVAIAGIIGWIGLIVPHTGRLLTGSNHQRLLPVAMGIGAILLLFTDTLARGLSATEIPLGILTSFVGAPFFLALLLRGNRP